MDHQSPENVLEDKNLSSEEKIKILKEMLLDEKLKAIAEDENMRPDTEENSDLDLSPEIIECLQKLGVISPYDDEKKH